jgi:hypothetical protein
MEPLGQRQASCAFTLGIEVVTQRIGWQLTLSGNCFVVKGIPEGYMFREISLIWEIQE